MKRKKDVSYLLTLTHKSFFTQSETLQMRVIAGQLHLDKKKPAWELPTSVHPSTSTPLYLTLLCLSHIPLTLNFITANSDRYISFPARPDHSHWKLQRSETTTSYYLLSHQFPLF